jgi:hypothetical protein
VNVGRVDATHCLWSYGADWALAGGGGAFARPRRSRRDASGR